MKQKFGVTLVLISTCVAFACATINLVSNNDMLRPFSSGYQAFHWCVFFAYLLLRKKKNGSM